MGRSLGTGIAVYLVQNRHVDGLILVSPYDSMKRIAKRHYPFDSLSRAPFIESPLLAIIAENDVIIPPDHSERLVDRWKDPHQSYIISNTNHNTIHRGKQYLENIKTFLTSHQ